MSKHLNEMWFRDLKYRNDRWIERFQIKKNVTIRRSQMFERLKESSIVFVEKVFRNLSSKKIWLASIF
jgi:hypothetical protein